jgi:hypothetical protein
VAAGRVWDGDCRSRLSDDRVLCPGPISEEPPAHFAEPVRFEAA